VALSQILFERCGTRIPLVPLNAMEVAMNANSFSAVKLIFIAGAIHLSAASVHAYENESPSCNLNSKSERNSQACAEWRSAKARSDRSIGGSPPGPGGLDAHAKAQENYAYNNCLRIQLANRKSAANARSFCAKSKP